jgi:hypothetical protein
MRHRVPARLFRLLTVFALLLGMQAASLSNAMSMPASASHCQDCGKSTMPATQCAAVCIFVLLPSNEPVSTIALANAKLRPALAAIPMSWSTPPETAPPRS